MIADSHSEPPRKGVSVFGLACAVLVLIGLVQLMISALALAERFKSSQQIRWVEKEVVKEVPVPMVVTPEPLSDDLLTHPVIAPPPVASVEEVPSVSPTPLKVPEVADSSLKRLIHEAVAARLAGDMGKAIIKLEQARIQSPEDPNALYELGLVHEQMGVFDKASEYYEQVFQMGIGKAGSLFESAAAKLRDGFAQPEDMVGKLALGRVRIFNNVNHRYGQQVILTIPVQKAPGDDVDVSAIEVEVRFFNKTSRGEVIELQDPSWAKSQWSTLPFDWAGNEECLRMTYTLPAQDRQTEHLFGALSYYGQLVTLKYHGEVLDVQAWPRELAAKVAKAPAQGVGELMTPEFQDTLPPDFDPSIPLLPPLPR